MAPGRRGGGSRGRGGVRRGGPARSSRSVAVQSRVADLDIFDGEHEDASPHPEGRIEDEISEEDVVSLTSEEESEPETPGQSYNALLEGFGHKEERAGSRRKRRRLNDHRDDPGAVSDAQRSQPGKASYNALLKAFNEPAAKDPGTSQSKQRDRFMRSASNGAAKPSLHEDVPDEHDLDHAEEDGASRDVEDLEVADEDDEDDADEDSPGDVDSDDEDAGDPFQLHLESKKDDDELKRLTVQAASGQWATARSPLGTIGQATVSSVTSAPTLTNKQPPKRASEVPFIKRKLSQAVGVVLKDLDDVQQALVTPLTRYKDISFGARTVANALSLRKLSCLHALNHVYKTRDRILKNNTRIVADADLEARDQGFTRPKVLFLLETRQNCAAYVDTIIDMSGVEQVENKKRLFDAFSSTDRHPEDMPEDFRELFDGNDDNVFRVGLKFTRKNLKFFSKFYASDIIFASPLGLRLAIEGKGPKHQDYDFLSSIELVIMDQADAMLMQNWEHVDYVFEHLNLQPKEMRGCDINRARNWYLEGQARYFRQTVVFSAFLTPTLLGLYSKHMRNISGKLKYQATYPGAIADPSTRLLSIKQTFSRFLASSPAADPDARFQYFTTAVLPSLTRIPKPANGGQGILIFVPSHADFSRLQNFFATSNEALNISFGAISEFTQTSDVRRARSHFERGRHSILLYSARAHHFRRYRLKGVRKVVFYGLPDNPVFYQELVGGFLGQSAADGKIAANETAVRVMFSKWDLLALERVVGSGRVAAMVKEGGGGDTFDFV